ncbi:MAG: hypothetical protein ACLFQ0_01145 [Cyclobacteriaceae bacterium]
MNTTLVQHKAQPEIEQSYFSFKKEVGIDFLSMTLFFAGAVGAVYYMPKAVNMLYFLAIMVLFFRTEKDYFWYAFFFILINTPAFLFFETSATSLHRLPLYRLTGGVSLSVFDLFVLTSIAKVIYKNKQKPFHISKPLRFLLVYFALVSIPITFLIGMGDSGFFNTFRPYFYYAVWVTFYFLVDDVKDVYMFGYLLVPYVFFTLFDQLFLLTQGELLISVINPETLRYVVENTITGGVRAYFSGFLLLFYIFLFGLQLRANQKYELFNGFSYLIIFSCLLAFIISATRIYLLIPLAVLIMYFIFSDKGAADFFRLTIAAAFFLVVFFSLDLISFDYFLTSIWPRFEAFFSLIFSGGNITQFDTVQSRLATDLPHIMKGVEYSPVIGTGFSGVFREHENNDLGFINTVLIFGVVGFLIFLAVIISMIIKLRSWSSRLGGNAKTVVNTVWMAMFGIILGYATTFDIFTVRQIDRIFFISILLATAEVAVFQATKRPDFLTKQSYKS